VEHSAEYETKALGRSLDGEAPSGAQQRGITLHVILVISLNDGGMGYRGMHVERHIERLRSFKNRPKPLVVEKDPVGQAVHQGTLEAKLGDCPLELVGCRLRVRGRNC